MAHSLSSHKRIRQNLKRRIRNRARKSVLKGRLRLCVEALAKRDTPTAEEAFRDVCRALDREAGRGLIHRNAAARRKSRLARKLNAQKAAAT
ncbi:MAG: 30S ribosomal protein S20 [Phycisphaerae bacterium]|nr:30S ribosomal protein S20 [Phycisphaerae bacterium]